MSEQEFTLRQKLIDNYDVYDIIMLLDLSLEDIVDELVDKVMDNPDAFRDLLEDMGDEEV